MTAFATGSGDPNGLAALTRRITELLERDDLPPSSREAIRHRLNGRHFPNNEALRFELDRLTAVLEEPPIQKRAR